MELEEMLPDWLCADFLHHCLQFEEDKQNIVILDFETSNAASSENSYSSCVFRVKVEYKDDEDSEEQHCMSIIIKSEASEDLISNIFDIVQFSEPIFYNRFIPEANKLVNTYFAPKSYFSPKFSVVVLEDLQEQGFVTADRINQLDFEHCRLYVDAAASFHAVSFAVHKENPELVESIGEEKLFSNKISSVNIFNKMIRYGMMCLIGATEKLDRFKKYCPIMSNVSDHLWDLMVEAHKPSGFLNTLNQGDPWTSNMMFKYDENGDVKEIKLLDFQALRFGSPVNDLVFFIWTSANHDVRRERLQEIYNIYVSTLNIKLKKLGCSEKMTHELLIDNVKRLSPMILFIVGMMLPFIYNPDPVNFGVFLSNRSGEVTEEINPYDKYYNNSFCKSHLPQLLQHLELAGIFDYLDKKLKE